MSDPKDWEPISCILILCIVIAAAPFLAGCRWEAGIGAAKLSFAIMALTCAVAVLNGHPKDKGRARGAPHDPSSGPP